MGENSVDKTFCFGILRKIVWNITKMTLVLGPEEVSLRKIGSCERITMKLKSILNFTRLPETTSSGRKTIEGPKEFHKLYKIEDTIGKGGFGTVFSALRLQDKVRVAVKEVYKAMMSASCHQHFFQSISVESSASMSTSESSSSEGESSCSVSMSSFEVNQNRKGKFKAITSSFRHHNKRSARISIWKWNSLRRY